MLEMYILHNNIYIYIIFIFNIYIYIICYWDDPVQCFFLSMMGRDLVQIIWLGGSRK